MSALRIVRHYQPDHTRQLEALHYILRLPMDLRLPMGKKEAAEDQSAAKEEARRVRVEPPR